MSHSLEVQWGRKHFGGRGEVNGTKNKIEFPQQRWTRVVVWCEIFFSERPLGVEGFQTCSGSLGLKQFLLLLRWKYPTAAPTSVTTTTDTMGDTILATELPCGLPYVL